MSEAVWACYTLVAVGVWIGMEREPWWAGAAAALLWPVMVGLLIADQVIEARGRNLKAEDTK